MVGRWVVAAICCALCVFIAGVRAVAQLKSWAVPLPANATALDLLLTNKQYDQLGEALSHRLGDEMYRNMNWEKDKLLQGASAYISFVYVFDLRLAASVAALNAERLPNAAISAGEAKRAAELEEDAVLVLLYAFELVAIDGMKCQDVTAPAHRRDQLFQIYADIWRDIAEMPEDRRTRLIAAALDVERRTASLRADDDFLCRNGIEERRAALAKNADPPVTETQQPSAPGKTVEVLVDPDYQPKFLAPEVSLPKQVEIRAAMPKRLPQMIERFKTRP
jgi:hypothetical protein